MTEQELLQFRWYKISPSDRQLTDSAGILAVSGDIIDNEYLDHWASEIGVVDLLKCIRAAMFRPSQLRIAAKITARFSCNSSRPSYGRA